MPFELKMPEPGQIPIALVGTKVDLVDQRVISTDMGETLANKFGCEFFEVSAKTRVNVEAPFIKVAQRALEVKRGFVKAKNGRKSARSNKCNLL